MTRKRRAKIRHERGRDPVTGVLVQDDGRVLDIVWDYKKKEPVMDPERPRHPLYRWSWGEPGLGGVRVVYRHRRAYPVAELVARTFGKPPASRL